MSKNQSHSNSISRRAFVGVTAAAVAGAWVGCKAPAPAPVKVRPRPVPRTLSPNEKLNLAFIGAGGRGAENLAEFTAENIVAFCDVDESRARATYQKFPHVARYRDFRVMLEREPGIDGVVISTPDHTHAVAAMAAMKLGKHVYCEKPLAHSIQEVRKMQQEAKASGVVTQMGIQGHAYPGARRLVKAVRDRAVGTITEVHAWTDRPTWPQGQAAPTTSDPIPPTLDWDLWLGPTPYRPFHSSYLPFNWRGFWPFGTGALGDMGCHILDAAYWALEWGAPVRIQAESSGQPRDIVAPAWSQIRYEFASPDPAAIRLMFWYDGGRKPPPEKTGRLKLPENGCLLIGTKGFIIIPDWHADFFQIVGGSVSPDLLSRASGETIERVSHNQDWVRACKGGPAPQTPFEYAGGLTEWALLGNIAIRTGAPLEWDHAEMKIRGHPRAEELLHAEYRKGWIL